MRKVYRNKVDPGASGKEAIRWLVAEPDSEDAEAYYLYTMPSLDARQFGDAWYESLQYLFDVAAARYGVAREPWQEFDAIEEALREEL